jgi:hypothetical protein
VPHTSAPTSLGPETVPPDLTDSLVLFWVAPDEGTIPFVAGQYVTQPSVASSSSSRSYPAAAPSQAGFRLSAASRTS